MRYPLNETHDPERTSWVASANAPGSDFPLQNLPFGVFRRRWSDELARLGVAIGNQVLDLAACWRAGLLTGPGAACCGEPALNALLALGHPAWSALRRQISALLASDSAERQTCAALLVPQAQAELLLPAHVGDYTDAYASLFHASTVGSLFRPDNPLLPNYKYLPIAYHGRASSLIASGTSVRRPYGQRRPDPTQPPVFGPCERLDYEAELAALIGPGNALGEPVALHEAEQQIFGLCLLNDWSARDIQQWEYQPLGPFLGKSFATSLAPWVVTLEALAPFRVAAFARAASDPPLLPYLLDGADQQTGGLAITVEVWLCSAAMRAQHLEPILLSRSAAADLYWTFAQLVTHHTANGCNLRPGDLIASGTISGAAPDARGCLLEITAGGTQPFTLPSGEQRSFLANGDEVILRGWCARPPYRRIGLGACRGVIATDKPAGCA